MRMAQGWLFALALSGAAMAQQWEIGGAGGVAIATPAIPERSNTTKASDVRRRVISRARRPNCGV